MSSDLMSSPGNFSAVALREEEIYSPIVSEYVRRVVTIINHTILGIPFNFLGCVGNTINIIIFAKIGFSENINISLFGLAISDLFSLITLQWLNICATPWFQYSDIPFESFEIQYLTAGVPHIAFARVTGFITAYISIERCLCVIMPLKVKNIVTPKRTTIFVVAVFILMIASIAPFYFVNGLGPKHYPSRNRTLVGIIYFDNKLVVEAVALSLNNACNYSAFIIIIFCTALLISTLNKKSKWRKETMVSGTAVDPAVSSSVAKDRKVVQMVTMISSIFIVCYIPMTVMFMTTMLEPEFSLIGKYQNLLHTLYPFVLGLEAVNSSVNIFIYFKMSSKYRSTFYMIFRNQKPS